MEGLDDDHPRAVGCGCLKRMKKPTKSIRPSRVRSRLAFGWSLVCFLFAAQSLVTAFASQCDLDRGSSAGSSMPDMDHSGAMKTHTTAVPSCEHCDSHTQGHGCSGLHSCSAQIAASRTTPLTVRVGVRRASLIPQTTPPIVMVAVTPPLRPPAA